MLRIGIDIETDNPKFNKQELYSVIAGALDRMVQYGDTCGTVFDAYGNRIGAFSMKED